MNYWIVPSNDTVFCIADAIEENDGMVDWRQSNNFAVGDIVFIYKGFPEQKIRYRMEVVEVDIKEEDANDKEEFWKNPMTYFDGLGRFKYVRFKLLEEYTSDTMKIENLRANGLKGNVQSVQHCPEDVVAFILNPQQQDDIPQDKNDIDIPLEKNNNNDCEVDYPVDDDNLYEGALVKVMANRYERSRDARDECIKTKGHRCLVCGMDFEEIYGDIGNGFIHVHHTVPISSIGKEYKIDVKKDLVPVCPNCHYMLHRKNPPYTIDELIQKMEEMEQEQRTVAAETIQIMILPKYHDGCVPLYNLRAACGAFEENETPEAEGWLDVKGHGFTPDPQKFFAVYAKGNSMNPQIHDNDICVFEKYTGGSRNGEIVLTQCKGTDADTGCNYTIKKYISRKTLSENGWQHNTITLHPLNPDYDDIYLDPDEEFKTIGIFKCVL